MGGVVVGRVAVLRRFPLRSAGGDLPATVRVGSAGLQHDRRWQLLDAAGAPVRVRDVPELAALTASVDDDDALHVRPGAAATAPLTAPLAADWPERLGGPGAHLEDSLAGGGAPHREGAAVHLVADGAADAPDAPAGCDPGERANVVLELDPAVARPGDERGWVGRRLRLQGPDGHDGGPLLLVTRTPKRCLGVYADVVEPGVVGVGAVVVLLDR